jgi:large subunit ribosomal protein L22
MATITAKLQSVRIAPRKVRAVTDLIKGLEVRDASNQLRFLVKRGSLPIEKLLKSAIANAHHNAKVAIDAPLFIRDIRVDEGRAYKRSMPRARGRASMFKKRTSHVTLVLETENNSKVRKH